MRNRTIAYSFVAFGLFFFIIGLFMFGISNTVGSVVHPWVFYDPSFYLATIGLAAMAVAFLFLILTFHFFRKEIFGED